ncbi:unnamed protein product [Schistosoma mattheei]|uniref:Secreted protein n=2 Tax=Schistosoma TaxID=6181 RepID=A0A183JZA6_9TREM|nr:unnamed protein product [Schistosoma curassoni]VDP32105.1 unnamed protein product [Schistosoma mattheei]
MWPKWYSFTSWNFYPFCICGLCRFCLSFIHKLNTSYSLRDSNSMTQYSSICGCNSSLPRYMLPVYSNEISICALFGGAVFSA